jgi:hypothetical protein
MKLEVPVIKQAKGSVDCGIAVVHMIAAYYKNKVTFDKIKSEIPLDKTGTYNPQLGSFFLKRGFGVEIVTFNPGLFTNREKGKNSKQLLSHLEKLLKTKKPNQAKKVARYFMKFIKDGGKLVVRIPNEEDIRGEIENKWPLIAVLTTNFFFGTKPRFNFHFNVVTGIDRKFVYANDPLPDRRGGKHKYPISEYLFAIYASANGGPDNPSIIKIRAKK